MEHKELYNNIRNFLSQDLEKVTKCVWFYKKEEEDALYNYYAMNLAGESVAIDVEKDYATLKKKVEFLFDQYRNEQLSFDEYSFRSLEIILSRYFGYIPRVNYNVVYSKNTM